MKQIIFLFILVLGFGLSAFAQNEVSSCPKIEVAGGGVVQPSNPIAFSVKLNSEAKNLNLEYEWTVSAGTIASGQGTNSILIDTTGLENTNITATVKIRGLSENCANTVSETGSVAPKLEGDPFDQFGKLPNDEVKARIQGLYVELGNNPDALGSIINYGTPKEVAKREKQIRSAIIFLKLDVRRLTMVKCGVRPFDKVWSVVWIVPSGAEFPTCD